MCIYKKLKRVSITFCLLFISNVFLAQSISVSGTVTDESNEGMPGVTVKEINGKATSTTDLEGFYKIQVESDASQLEFSFIGYKKQVVLVGGRNNIDVNLKVMSEALD